MFAIGAAALVYATQVFIGAGQQVPVGADGASPSGSYLTTGPDGRPTTVRGSTAPPTTASASPRPTATAAKPPPKAAGSCATSTRHVLDGSDGNGGCWPGPSNTGVPAGVKLTTYTGPCTITKASTVISAKLVKCDLEIRAAKVVIEKTQVNGTVSGGGSPYSFTIKDSYINATPGAIRQVTGVGDANYTLLRVEITGGNRGAYCASTCTIRDSWVHGQQIKDDWHASAIRMEQHTTIVHTALACDAKQQSNPEGSCSGSLTGYGDFAAVRDNLIDNNLFLHAEGAAYCAYGGSSKGKPYSSQTANIVFRDNVFQRGTESKCAYYAPVGDWDGSRPGNVWSNNRYADGVTISG